MMQSNAYGIGAFDHHIELVYKIAIKNYEEYGADRNIVALAALFHDVASITNKDFTENHHIIGTQIAEEILKEYDLKQEKIELIKRCLIGTSVVLDEIKFVMARMAYFWSFDEVDSIFYEQAKICKENNVALDVYY